MTRIGMQLLGPLRLVLPLAALAGHAVAQGDNGFLRGAGRTDLSLSYAFDSYDEFWVGGTKVEDPAVGEVARESVNLFVAHGLRSDLDLFAAASWVDVESDGTNDFNDETQLQDAVGGVKWRVGGEQRIGPGAFSFLLAPSVKIPMSHYESNSVTAIGDGQLDYRARGIAHYRLDSGFWLSVESGFDYRTEQPGNEIPLNITLGLPVTRYVTVMPFWSQVSSEGDLNIGQGDFPAVEEDSTRLGVSLYARIDERLGFTAGWKTTRDGKNTGDVDGYWFGVVYRL